MPNSKGLTGSPWHIENIHNNDPDDTRRHRAMCAYHIKTTKMCKKRFALCAGAAHCSFYLEKNADMISDTTEEAYYQPVFNNRRATSKT